MTIENIEIEKEVGIKVGIEAETEIIEEKGTRVLKKEKITVEVVVLKEEEKEVEVQVIVEVKVEVNQEIIVQVEVVVRVIVVVVVEAVINQGESQVIKKENHHIVNIVVRRKSIESPDIINVVHLQVHIHQIHHHLQDMIVILLLLQVIQIIVERKEERKKKER